MHENAKKILKKKDLEQAEKSLTKKQENIWSMDVSYCTVFDKFYFTLLLVFSLVLFCG